MSVQLVNDHVLIPHPADWSTLPAWRRRWRDAVAAGTRGAEDRTGLAERPLIELTWTISPIDHREWSTLEDRIRAAVKSGQSAAPYHGRGTKLLAQASGTTVELVSDVWPFQAGDLIFLQVRDPWSWDSYEVAEIDSVDGTTLTLTAALAGTYPAGGFAWPLLFGRLSTSHFTAFHNRRGSVQVTLAQLDPLPALAFDAALCGVTIGGSAVEEGGDTFDCYTDAEAVTSLPLAGTGFDGPWVIGGDDQELLGDDLDSYPVANPPGLLEGGTGFNGAWQFWDEDAVDLLERTIGGVPDIRFRLRSTDIGRYLVIGTNWNTIRIATRQSIPDTGANIPSPLAGHWIGVIADPGTNMANGMKSGLSTQHVVGIVNTTTTWARTAGPPVTYGRNHQAFRIVGTTVSTFNSVGSTVFAAISGDPANNRTPQIIEIEKGNPNFTVRQIRCFPPELVRIDYPDFILKMAMEADSMAGAANILQSWAIVQGSTGTTPWEARSYTFAVDEATNGFFDALVLNRSSSGTDPLMEWSDVLFRIMS